MWPTGEGQANQIEPSTRFSPRSTVVDTPANSEGGDPDCGHHLQYPRRAHPPLPSPLSNQQREPGLGEHPSPHDRHDPDKQFSHVPQAGATIGGATGPPLHLACHPGPWITGLNVSACRTSGTGTRCHLPNRHPNCQTLRNPWWPSLPTLAMPMRSRSDREGRLTPKIHTNEDASGRRQP